MSTTLFTTWPMIRASHASAGNGKTLCGRATDPASWEEGGFIDAGDDDGVSCAKCQSAMRKIAAKHQESTTRG